MSKKIVNDLRHDKCPLCYSGNIFLVGDIPYFRPIFFSTHEIELERQPELWSCRNCNSSFSQNTIPRDVAADLYSNGSSAERWKAEPFMLQKPDNQLATLRNYLTEGKVVIDVGCNTGELLDYAKSRGCKTAGVEYSKGSGEILVAKGHMAYHALDEVAQQFDVITAFDLIEHLYDLPAFLENCNARLKSGGHLIILTGNIGSLSSMLCRSRWWYVMYPEHVVFPSRKFFAHLHGFRMVRSIGTYAARNFQYGRVRTLRSVVSSMFRGNYLGLPSLGPDHMLLVLEKQAGYLEN